MSAGVAARKRSLPPWPARRPLRAWQQRALDALAAHDGEAFLASATPAAGKTTFGLRVAYELLNAGRVQRVAILAPTAHIARQWAADAARYGIDLEPNRPNAEGPEPWDRHGVAVTYQAVAAGPAPHRRACAQRRTLLIADEPHHMGEDASWGITTMDAFARAELRLLLSGTPFRSDNSPIPWVEYDADGFSSADYTYTYTDALVDGVCRPITFVPYDGDMEWLSDGKRRRADFSVVLPRAEDARRLRTALDASGDWVRRVLRDADARLAEVRAGDHPDAGGLVVATDKQHAVELAVRLEAISGEAPMIVTSDEADASQRIARFAAGTQRWIVSVLMVSEGVDIPRLRVGVYATSARTELFFRQVVGRFIRRSPAPRRQMSYLFLPSDITLKALAGRIEEERNHAIELRPVVEEGALDEPPERVRSEPGDMFEALSSDARPDELIAVGENLSLFGDPEPRPSAAFVAFTGGAVAQAAPADELPTAAGDPGSSYQRRERLREERGKLVAQRARATRETHREINARVNRAVGVRSVADATLEQLARANELLRRELERGR
ncbi:MAG: DEAD/DEAH box helicase family protein [Actinobacteria bacterium]|nr:DEAD/DEAH box helicase family protein [Actinomycetota bacterium]